MVLFGPDLHHDRSVGPVGATQICVALSAWLLICGWCWLVWYACSQVTNPPRRGAVASSSDCVQPLVAVCVCHIVSRVSGDYARWAAEGSGQKLQLEAG